jgi:murein DD-endopeptidase MepM/ murein hydrolase activator NlpD
MLIVAIFLGVVVAAVVRSLSERYLFVPVLSIPFLFTSWLVIAAGQKFQGLVLTTAPFEIELLNGIFPAPLEFMFRSFGAAFFQLNIPSGILVTLGILLFSRQAFLLATLALFSGSYFHLWLGGSLVDLQGYWIGFNFALTAIAVGGMFIVPGPSAYLLALASALLSAVVTAGSTVILSPIKLPVLAFPFLLTTIAVLYALQNRISPRFLQSIPVPAATPEQNLKNSKNRRARFVTGEIPAFELPVSGEWTVTQGFNGEHTHKHLWAHAWDFEVLDEEGKQYREPAIQLRDYYSWNMPVFAPADGKIIHVIAHIEDNPPGQVDTEHNWGNTIVLWHYGSVYTTLAHLSKGSVTVSEGEIVRRGQLLGKVGNSGRSPYPHLHFHVQYSPEVGAPTVPSELLNYVAREDKTWVYHTHGIPCQSQVLRPLEMDASMAESASFPVGHKWEFAVSDGRKKWHETWETEMDFAGNRFLVCKEKRARLQIFVNNKFLFLLDYQGPVHTALHWLFLAVPRLPFTVQEVTWHEEMPPEMVLGLPRRMIFDIMEPFCPLARLETESRFLRTGSSQFTVKTRLSLQGMLAARTISQTEVVSSFERYKNLTVLMVRRGEKTILEAEQTG